MIKTTYLNITLQNVLLTRIVKVDTELLTDIDFLKYLKQQYPFHYQLLVVFTKCNWSLCFNDIEQLRKVFNSKNFSKWVESSIDDIEQDFKRNTVSYYMKSKVITGNKSFDYYFKDYKNFNKKIDDFDFNFDNFGDTLYYKFDNTYYLWKHNSILFNEIQDTMNDFINIVNEYYNLILIPNYIKSSHQIVTKNISETWITISPLLYEIYKYLWIYKWFKYYELQDIVRNYNQVTTCGFPESIFNKEQLENCNTVDDIVNILLVKLYGRGRSSIKSVDPYLCTNIRDLFNINYMFKQDFSLNKVITQFIKESIRIIQTCNLDVKNIKWDSLDYSDLSIKSIINYQKNREINYIYYLINHFIKDSSTIENNEIFQLYSKSVQQDLLQHPDFIIFLCVFLSQIETLLVSSKKMFSSY